MKKKTLKAKLAKTKKKLVKAKSELKDMKSASPAKPKKATRVSAQKAAPKPRRAAGRSTKI